MKATKKSAYAPLADGDLLTEAQAAALIHYDAMTLRAWRTNKRHAGKGPTFIQQGQGRALYHRADLAAWAAKNRHDPAVK